jgi:exosortase A-associated hydrolase 2
MTSQGDQPGAEPFFLKNGAGQRFCLYHRPAGPCRGAVLYVHPFAEELNRSRRMATLQARRLAAHGYGVLQIDLYGCGDSSGDFGDARWDVWKQDLALASAWLRERLQQPVTLWGLRLGALLALDYAREARHPLGPMLLWQPVIDGSSYLTQFLRLRTMGAMLGDENTAHPGTQGLRAALQSGQTLEIAGYDLTSELALAIDDLTAPEVLAPAVPVHWFEMIGTLGQGPSAATTRVAAAWRDRGADLQVQAVPGPPFWATSEISTSPALLDATTTALLMDTHAV